MSISYRRKKCNRPVSQGWSVEAFSGTDEAEVIHGKKAYWPSLGFRMQSKKMSTGFPFFLTWGKIPAVT